MLFSPVTCMEARLAPQNSFGCEIGEYMIICNSGGSTLDAVRSIILTDNVLGLEEVYVMKHTRGGLLGATNEMVHTAMKANLGADKAADVDSFEALPVANLEQSVSAEPFASSQSCQNNRLGLRH
jgi:carbonic anhydrase